MTAVLSIDDTKNWEILRQKLNAAFAAATFDPDTAYTWNALQDFAAGALIKGTTTNDDAPAGYVGEYIPSTILVGAGVALTSNVAANITSLTLAAGDYEIDGAAWFQSSAPGAITFIAGWASVTSATFPTSPNSGLMAQNTALQASQTASANFSGRVSLAAPATLYLGGVAVFTGTAKGFGFIGARRAR